MLFERLSKLWMQEKRRGIKESTFSVYRETVLKHLLPIFGTKRRVKKADVQSFVNQKIREGLSQKTTKDALVVLKMIVDFGKERHLFRSEEIKPVFQPSNRSRQIQVLQKKNQRKLLNWLVVNENLKNLGLLICLTTGIRIGEICGLKWADIDFRENELNINRTLERIYTPNEASKTKLIFSTPKTLSSCRKIPLCSLLTGLLRSAKTGHPKDSFVLSGTLKPIEPRIYRNYFKSVLANLRIPAIKFHGLRHTFATRCIESNGDYKTVSSILGHANIATTLNLYVHPNEAQKKKCIEKMLKSI